MSGHSLNEARRLEPKETSQIIRKALKTAFPHVKFSVRTKDYGTINIRWTDGPTAAMVEAIAQKYEGKGFDGMIDMSYHIDGWMLNGEIVGTRCRGTLCSKGTVKPWGLVAPHDDCELVDFGAGFIFCNRDLSPEFRNRCAEKVAKECGIATTPTAEQSNSLYVPDRQEWFSQLVYRESVRRAVLAA